MTQISADRGDTNVYDLDATIAIDGAADKIWFTCKRRLSEADADAVVRLGLNVAGIPTGIVVTDAPLGKFQIQIPKAALKSVEDSALLWDCQFFDASVGGGEGEFTVASGTMRLTGEVTKST